jgi:hypothetical protein
MLAQDYTLERTLRISTNKIDSLLKLMVY